MTDHAIARGHRPVPSAALTVAAATGGLILVAGAVTAGAAFHAIALVLATISAGVIIWRPEWGVFVLTSTFFLSYPEAFSGSGNLTINNVVGLLLAGVLAVRTMISRRIDVLDSPILRMMLVLWFLLFLNRLVADGTPPFASLSRLDLTDMRAADFVSKFWFLFFVIAFIRARWQVMVFALSLVLFVLITAPNAIANALTAWNAVATGGRNIEQMRAAADFGIMAARNANRLAFLCDLVIAIIACAMLRLRWRWLNVAGTVVISLLVITVFLSASRSGLINLLLLAVYFISRVGIPMRRLVISGLVTAVAVLLVLQLVPGQYLGLVSQEEIVRKAVTTAATRNNIPSAYLDRITSFVMGGSQQAGVEASTENRLELALTGLRMFVDHPVMGVGLGNFRWRSIVEYQNPHVSALHNSYILTLTEGGLVIFLAYVALFVIVFKVLGEARRRAAERPEIGLGWLVEATQIMFMMFLIFSAFADCWHEAYLVFLGALATVLARLYAPAAAPAPRSATA